MRNWLRRGFADFFVSPTQRYCYFPTAALPFNQGKLCLYRHEGWTARGLYLTKVYFTAVTFALTLPYDYILNTALLGLTSVHLLARCRLVREVRLLESGKELEIDYVQLPFLHRTEVVRIRDLANPPNWPLIRLWSLKPLVRNMTAALETSPEELLPWYVPTAQHFYLFPKHPSTCRLDLLANTLLGVHIDTTTVKPKSHSLSHQYSIS